MRLSTSDVIRSLPWVTALIFFLLVFTLVYPGEEPKWMAKRTVALANAKDGALACLMYAADHDDRLPIANKWMDLTDTYRYQKSSLFSPDLPYEPGIYGFAFRRRVASHRAHQVANPETTALVFDSTNTGKNASGGLELLPRPGRHNGKDAFAFADGHSRMLDPNDPLFK